RSSMVEPRAIAALPGAETDKTQAALTGELAPDDLDLPHLSPINATSELGLPDETLGISALKGSTEDPVARLRSMIGERQEETVEILRGWLEDKEENA
ncbi:MAG: hypothetical protein V7727_22230, partial [Sneathiella sp.]